MCENNKNKNTAIIINYHTVQKVYDIVRSDSRRGRDADVVWFIQGPRRGDSNTRYNILAGRHEITSAAKNHAVDLLKRIFNARVLVTILTVAFTLSFSLCVFYHYYYLCCLSLLCCLTIASATLSLQSRNHEWWWVFIIRILKYVHFPTALSLERLWIN